MYKLYKRDQTGLHYHEVWEQDGAVIEHFGQSGMRGECRRHEIPEGANEDQLMEALLESAALSGFEEIADEDLIEIRVEIARPKRKDDNDLAERHVLEDRLDDLLGETGLGHCDGGCMNKESMEAFCFVPDADIAMDVIREDLSDAGLIELRRVW